MHDIDPERLIAVRPTVQAQCLDGFVGRNINPNYSRCWTKQWRTDGTWSRTDFEWDR